MEDKNSQIMLIDDDDLFRETTQMLFEHKGIFIKGIENGDKATEELKRNIARYQTIMVDLDMPGMDGIETYKEIRKIDNDIPIIIVSAFLGEPKWEKKIKELKQIHPKDIIARIDKPLPIITSKDFDSITNLIKQAQNNYLENKKIKKEKNFDEDTNILRTSIEIVNNHIIDIVASDPNFIYKMTPREFEELIAELFRREGFEILLTPISKDGGKDLYAYRIDMLGKSLYAIECKRYRPPRKVGRPIVQQFNGIIEQENLSGGIIATTSYFTKEAKDFVKPIKYRLFLQDFEYIIKWIKKHSSVK
jgi:CheY-like chemotaxis protein